MLYFTIALRGRASTNQWDKVVADFENTLNSIFGQNSPEFCVYVGCNDIPQLSRNFGNQLHFVEVNTPRPQGWLDCCRDRAWKQLACCAAIKHELGEKLSNQGIFVFPVDADDFVSNRLAEYVAQHPDANGFKSAKSYKWYKGSKVMEITPYFGGSMNIMRLKPDELPEELPDISLCFDKATCIQLNEKYPVRWDDIAVEEKMRKLGRPFRKLPFCSTIYVLNTGENISTNDPRATGMQDKKIHLGILAKKANPFIWKKIDEEIIKEFSLVNLQE